MTNEVISNQWVSDQTVIGHCSLITMAPSPFGNLITAPTDH
jgi:hypothetical protein